MKKLMITNFKKAVRNAKMNKQITLFVTYYLPAGVVTIELTIELTTALLHIRLDTIS